MKLRGRSRAGGRWRGSDVKQRGRLEELKPTRITSDVVSMEEARLNEDVENVNPAGGLREQSRRKLGLRTGLHELRSKDRAGVLAPNPTLGNGGGAVDALEWLKDRVSQHRLASECQPQPDSGSRRHQRLSRASGLFSKGLGSGVVAGREQSSVVSHPLPSQSASSIQSRNSVDRLEGATKNQQVSAVQAGAKSPWGATTRGALHIYEDDTVNSQGQRDSSRRELNIKSTDTKLQGTPSLVASSLAGAEIEEQSQVSLNAPCRRELNVKPTEKKLQGTASLVASGTKISMYRSSKLQYDLIIAGAEIEEQSQVSLKAPSNVGVSKFEYHYDHDDVCVKQLSPQASTHSESSSGIWRGSKVRGTPYRQTLQHSHSSVVNQPESGSRDQHFSSNGQATGLNLIDSKNGRSSVTSRDRQELVREPKVEKISPGVAAKVTVPERRDRDQLFSSREQAAGGTLLKSEKASSSVTSYDRREISSKVVKVSAVERKSPSAAADTVAELATRPQINQNFPTKLQELKFRIQQQTALKSLDSRKSANSIGSSRWSPGDEQDSLYSYALPMPEKMGVSSSSCMEAFQCKGKNAEELVSELENDGADFSVDLPHVSPQPHLRNGEQNYEKGHNHKIVYESRTAMCEEKVSKNGGSHSEVRANQAFPRSGSLPPLTEPQIAVTVSAGAGSSMWSRSSAMSRNQIGDGYSPPDHVSQDGGTKWTSTNNMDSVGPDSALLASEVTGASSSGSSATPCVMGNSSLDDVTQKSCGSVPASPAVEKSLSSYKLSNVHQPRRAKKPSRSLGPPGRVLRTDLSTCNSRISPACAIATVIESGGSSSVTAEEEVAKNGGQLEFPGSDQRKRKAERDLGNGDTSLILEHGSSVPANLQEKNSEGGAVQAQWQLAQEPREMGSMPCEPPSASVSEENVGEAVDMSYTGFSAQGNKENVPMPLAVPHLSSGVCSLSLGGEDVPKKDESKVLSTNSRSPVSTAAPTSQVTVLKSVENCRAPLPASHPERSVISVEKRSCDAERISPSTSGSAQANESAEGVPSNSAEDSGGSAQQSARDTGKDVGQGATTTSQTKKFENSHFVWVNNERYQKLGKVGKGGSSEVFKVIDRDCNIYALKKISLKGRDHRAALGFYQEIEYLEMLRGKGHVVQLIAYEVTDRAVIREDYDEEKITEDAYIYMILEFGEIDLAGILTQKRKEMMDSNQILDDNWLLDFKFYWKHMLLSVKTIHDERIVHADLKPANFLLVKGKLKLIDFGIAKAIQNDTTHIVRDSQVGTLNYMSPEAFMANSMDEEGRMVKCGRASDIWSLGCILYQMVYGHTPFSKVTSFYAKIQAITSKNHKIEFPPIKNRSLLDVMQKCLTWDRTKRPQITELLEHPFLRSE